MYSPSLLLYYIYYANPHGNQKPKATHRSKHGTLDLNAGSILFEISSGGLTVISVDFGWRCQKPEETVMPGILQG